MPHELRGLETGLKSAQVSKLMRMRDGDEAVFDGVVWTRMDNADDEIEYKVSPKGTENDFDTDCYWVERESVYQDQQFFRRVHAARNDETWIWPVWRKLMQEAEALRCPKTCNGDRCDLDVGHDGPCRW